MSTSILFRFDVQISTWNTVNVEISKNKVRRRKRIETRNFDFEISTSNVNVRLRIDAAKFQLFYEIGRLD